MCFGSPSIPDVEVPEIPAPPPVLGQPIATPVPPAPNTSAAITPTPEAAKVNPVPAVSAKKVKKGTGTLRKEEPKTETTGAAPATTGVNYSGTASAGPRGASLNIQKR
tara:strand:+ start:5449 stop:5772 length:324 start_codon:yes stop_codon:yes gene_type:complete